SSLPPKDNRRGEVSNIPAPRPRADAAEQPNTHWPSYTVLSPSDTLPVPKHAGSSAARRSLHASGRSHPNKNLGSVRRRNHQRTSKCSRKEKFFHFSLRQSLIQISFQTLTPALS